MNFATHIIDECLNQGITHFCTAPGSRSTPLILALAKNKKAQVHIHFDERGLSFFALGLAKACKRPVAIITTSGSAVGNLLPALMEADNAHIPLILITADRPFELKGCGANQTTDQVKIFEPFVRTHIDLPASAPRLGASSLRQRIAHAIYTSEHSRRGPIHINCQFREPFLPLHEEPHASIRYSHTAPHPSTSDLQLWADTLASCKRGIILAGADSFASHPDALFSLTQKLQWPLLADPLSGARCSTRGAVTYFNHLPTMPSPDGILHFGDRLVSKTLLQWIEKSPPAFYGLVSIHPHHHDPLNLLTHRMTCLPELFCTEIAQLLPSAQTASRQAEWYEKEKAVKQAIEAFFAREQSLSEPGLFHFLQTHLPSSWSLFLSNSMPIRDADSFFFPARPQAFLTANRGVSGIDGNIATAMGCADIAILGDLATLHDINSLALVYQRKKPIILLIINNQGGGIFSFLPVAQGKTEIFETHFATAHPFTFKEAAAQFNIPYANPQTKSALEETLLNLFKEPKTSLIEINTCRDKNYTLHQTIKQQCSLTP